MMTPEDRQDLAAVAAALRAGAGVYAVEVDLQIKALARAGVRVDVALLEAYLGYPLAEASRDELRGVIAALLAVEPAGGRP